MPAGMPRRGLSAWLNDRAVRKGGDKPITHTRIPSATRARSGGSYHVPDSELAELNQLCYQHIFVDGHEENLTEVQRHVGPLMIDLDFRYDVEVDERQHTEAHVFDTVEQYAEILKDILDLSEVEQYHVWVMEKPSINPQSELVKDGIHIVIGLMVDRATRRLVRDRALEELPEVFTDLPLINPIGEVVDKGVAHGTINWQMYGSRKPDNEAYRIVKAYTVTNAGESIAEAEGAVQSHRAVLERASARSQGHPHPPVSEAWTEQHEAAARASLGGKKRKQEGGGGAAAVGATASPSWGDSAYSPQTNSVGPQVVGQPLAEIREQVETMLDELPFHESHLRDAHAYAQALGPEYYNPRDTWLRVGWALRNTSPKLFGSWVLFSSRSKKFHIEDVGEMFKTWNAPQPSSKSPITDRSLSYWCRTSNPQEFERLRQSSIGQAMELSLLGATEFDVATVMHRIFQGEFRCANVKHRVWYQYTGHYWKLSDEGTTLRMQISQYLSPLYRAEVTKLQSMLMSMEEGDEAYDRVKKKAGKYNNIAIMLKKTGYKNNVMRECCELFYDRDFLDKLDRNPLLLGCENGVVDFEQGIFRPGLPDDYISTTTGQIYDAEYAHSPKAAQTRDKIKKFMEMLFTDRKLEEYMWEHLSSVLIGTNENEMLNLYNGEGSNGKSKLVDFMTEVLGAYKGTVPVSLVISKRTSIGNVSPEIAMLRSCRYAVMQEPSKGDKLNEGILKELTGGDPIQGRGLYQEPVNYVPQFSLVVCCNEMFDVKSADHGTWRRMGVVNYTSKFVDEPSPDNPLEFKKDKKLKKNFATWAPIMLVMLAERAFKNKGEVELCEAVKVASNQYRSSQNHVAEFLEERIQKAPGRVLRWTDVHEEFKDWFSDMHTGRAPSGKDLKAQLSKRFGDMNKKANGWADIGLVQVGGGYAMMPEDDVPTAAKA